MRTNIEMKLHVPLLLALALALAGCAVGPRLDTSAADPTAPSASGAPMPSSFGVDAATDKTNELLAAVGADNLDGLKPMDHSKMGHDGMQGMDHSKMEGMDHSKMPGHSKMQHDAQPAAPRDHSRHAAPAAPPAPDATAATVEEMKKTEAEMKRASEELKVKEEALKMSPGTKLPAPDVKGAFVCPMHPEVTAAAPAKCPKCGMALKPKVDGTPHQNHQP